MLRALFIFTVFLLSGYHALAADPVLVLIAGGSASGKSYLTQKLAQELGPENCTVVYMDNYFAPQEQPPEHYINGGMNFDHPSAVNLKKLKADLESLRAGHEVTVKEYTYGRKVDHDNFLKMEPRKYILVDGIHVLNREADLPGDLKIFVNAGREMRLGRRIVRDQKERGETAEAVESYFNAVVDPMHQEHIQPTLPRAEVVIEGTDDPAEFARSLAKLKNRIEALGAKLPAQSLSCPENFGRFAGTPARAPL